ncbi:MAG: response regulator [Halobacteriovoraceae bacterium]|nr:response regulator [Halobacteriovoraceae bacterium]
MKVLIIDDDDTIRQLAVLCLTKKFPASDFVEAADGSAAITLLGQDKFDLIICDFEMPNKNGSDVYHFIKEQDILTPFILHTTLNLEQLQKMPSSFPDVSQFEGYVNKMETRIALPEIIKKVVTPEIFGPDERNSTDFYKIKIYYFWRFDETLCDIWVGLSSEKFVKIIHKNSEYTKADIDKYIKKKQKYLYIHKDDFENFCDGYQKLNFLVRKDKPFDASDENERRKAHAYIHHIILEIGITQEVVEITKRMIENIFSTPIKGQTEIFKMMIRHFEKRDYIYDHSYMAAQISCFICKQTEWASDDTLQKLILASIYHDVLMTDPNVAMVEDLACKEFRELSPNDKNLVRNHPYKTAELVRENITFPADVDKIIWQHHEKQDGSGFPRGLDHTQITPLAIIFIIAHDFVKELYREQLDESQFMKIQKKLEIKYDKGNFKKIYTSFVKSLNKVNLVA